MLFRSDLVAQGEASTPVWVLIHFAGFVFLVFCWWVVWIVLLGCSIPGCWIVWIVLLGCVDSECVDLVAGFVFLVFCRWVVWIPV